MLHQKLPTPIFTPAAMSPQALAQGCFVAKQQFYAWSSIARRVLGGHKPRTLFGVSTSAIANVISRCEVYRKQGLGLGQA